MIDDSGSSNTVYSLSWILVNYLVAVLNIIAFLVCFFFLISFLISKNGIILYNAYNLYIFFLIIPDALITLMRGILEIFRIMRGDHNFPLYFTNFYMGFWTFYFISNLYLNAILTYEINVLIHRSYRRIKTAAPKLRRVLVQVGCVYTFSFLLALWFALDVPWSPIDVGNRQEKFIEEDRTVVFKHKAFFVIGFSLIGIPIIYVITIRILIWKNQLLPKSGRTRVLSLFFMRIIVVFLAFYLPNTVLSSLLDKLSSVASLWGATITALLTSLQAFVTLFMVSYKEDISSALTSNIQEFKTRSSQIFFCRLTKESKATIQFGIDDDHSNEISGREDNNELENNNRKRSQWDEEDVYDGDDPDELVDKETSATTDSFNRQERHESQQSDMEK